jgi:3-(3-hydroxy-phenyl)propionate hydroxylase
MGSSISALRTTWFSEEAIMDTNSVVIIGAGPTGMAAAALLAKYGVSTIVVEREPEVVPIPRAVHLDEEVLRILHGTCLGPELAAQTRPIRGMVLVDRERRPLITFSREGLGMHGFSPSNGFDQPELDGAMRVALAREPHVTLRAGTSVEAVEPLADGSLRVTVHDHARNVFEDLKALAVLGCDGARSRTRAFVGTEFEDLGFEARWLVVDVALSEPIDLYDGCLQVADPDRPTTYFQTGGGRHRWELMLRDDERPEEMTHEARVRELLTPWLGSAVERAKLRRAAVYTFHSLVARRFRRGNVFLLGDAAHQTPPFIGQGMGAGVRDAANLAWKLAAVVQGRARPELLDTYESERRPHVRSVIAQAVLLGRTMRTRLGGTYRNRVLRQVGSFGAFHALMLRRAFPAYGAGPLVHSARAGGFVPRALVELEGRQVHIDELLGGEFVILRARDAQPGGKPAVTVQPVSSTRSPSTVVDRDGALSSWLAGLGAQAALVRPDRIVMACGRARDAERWLEALSQACGWEHRATDVLGYRESA